MNRFVVMVEGRNLAMRPPTKKHVLSIFLSKASLKRIGFFATRCVVANTESEAEDIVLGMIKIEIRNQFKIENSDFDPPVFLISETRRVNSPEDPGIGASGFSFYINDDLQ